MPRFQVGDRVRCISMDPSYSGRLNVGQVYTVRRITGDMGDVWITVVENDGRWRYEAIHFEPLNAWTPRFRVGDRVRIQNRRSTYMLLGDVGEIVDVPTEEGRLYSIRPCLFRDYISGEANPSRDVDSVFYFEEQDLQSANPDRIALSLNLSRAQAENLIQILQQKLNTQGVTNAQAGQVPS